MWYVATWRERWVAQLNISAAALKCGVRDRWIGWDFRSQYGRLKLIANNSRFLILPDWQRPNIGSRVLSLSERRVGADWQARFGHPLLLLETVVDPRRAQGWRHRLPVVLGIAADITWLRRFAVGILKSFQKPAQSIAEMMRTLGFRTRLVFDNLRMTKNSVTGPRAT